MFKLVNKCRANLSHCESTRCRDTEGTVVTTLCYVASGLEVVRKDVGSCGVGLGQRYQEEGRRGDDDGECRG
jgi:hypothetical protein